MASLRNEFTLNYFLESLQVRVGLASPLRDELRTLRLKIGFLQVFLSCGINNIENRRLQALLLHITTVFQNVDLDIRRCRADFKFSSEEESQAFDRPWEKLDTEGWWFPMNLVDLLYSAQQKLELLQPHIHEVYTILSKSSSRSTLHGDSKAAISNLFYLRWNIDDLLEDHAEMVAHVKEELKVAGENLTLLYDLLRFTTERCSKLGKLKDLIIHAEFLAYKMLCRLYMCSSSEKMNDSMVNEKIMHLVSELQNFSPAESHVRQIYIKALKASKLAQGHPNVVDKSGWDFLRSLKNNILQLPDTNFNFMASDKDQILSLSKDLKLLQAIAMYKSSESVQSFHMEAGIPKLYQTFNNFQERISAAIRDMGCLIFSLHKNEQTTNEAKELKRAVSDLEDIIKTAKGDVKKTCDTEIPKSWHSKTKFRRTNAQGMMDSLMSISGQIERSLFYEPSCYLSKVLKKKVQSLVGTFINLTGKQQLEHGEFEIQMARLNQIRSKTKSLVLLLLESRNWEPYYSLWLWLFVLIEEIEMIKKELRNLENQMMLDTSTSMPHGRMNPQGKETMIDYAEISEDQPERTGKQLIDGSKKPNSFPVSVGMDGIVSSAVSRGSAEHTLQLARHSRLDVKWSCFLQDHRSNLDLICPQKDAVKVLILRAGFLKIFLSCKGIWHIEDGNLKVLLTHIHNVFQGVEQDHRKLWLGLNIQTSPKEVWYLPMNMDCLLSSVLSMLQHLEPDIQGAYAILSKSSIFITGISDEALMEILNILLENVEVLLKCNIELVAPLKEELEAVQKSLRFQRNFLGFTMKGWSKLRKLKDLLIHSEFLVGKISCLLYLCCNTEKLDDHMMNEMNIHFSYELQRFSPAQPGVREIYIKALKTSKSAKGNSNFVAMGEFVLGFLDSLQDDILELSDNNLSFIASDKEQILSWQKELKFLITFFTMDRSLEEHSELDQISTSLFEHLNAVVIDLGCVIYLLNDDENIEMMTREQISDLVANVKVAKADIRKIYDFCVPRPLQFDFPRTNEQGFIGSLFYNLNELLNTKPELVAPLKYPIEIVRNELLSLRTDFCETAKQPNQCDELQRQWTCFLDIAYQSEFIIDSFIAGGDSFYCYKLGLFNVLEEIKKIKTKLKAIKNKLTDDTLVQKTSQMSLEANFPGNNSALSSEERPTDEKSTSKLVLFKKEEEKIREQLTMAGSQDLSILSIVGMPGIGKTTLANSVFQHPSVTYHFHVRARYSVSQVLDKRRLLLEILQQFSIEGKQGGDDDVGDLEQRLKRSLMGSRYLILLDDIWNIQHWNDIKACFPNDCNGSRIIFTSRFEDIASQKQTGWENKICYLSLLSDEICWEMLKVKIFGDTSCPLEHEKVGRQIAANCKGLPLTVDLIAGVLQEQERENWEKVVESFMTVLFKDPQGRCRKALELSYQYLSDDLKPCFLYFAAFPEDANVPTRDLILLWIAEGFVKLENSETRSLEDVARDILNSLIRRSLVTVSQRGPLGGVIESCVHDLLHEFVVAKAQEESFMLKIDEKTEFSPSVHNQWKEKYRLCIYPKFWRRFPKSISYGPRTRALISSEFPSKVDYPSFMTCKLLRVLYLDSFNPSFFPEMFTLVHLKLLVISTLQDSPAHDIFSNIHKLWNLETFIVNTNGYKKWFDENLLLDQICNMERLRHFCLGGYIRIKYLKEKMWQKASFANLRTLYTLKASYEEDIEKILKLMPNLVELKILFYNFDGGCYPFPKLDFLNKLESLEVEHENYSNQLNSPCKIICFPPHLKRLVLSNFGVPWTEISEIGNHEYLEALELKENAFKGPIWEMVNGQFPKLKYLSLFCLDIEEWNALENHLSCLEQLHVTQCRKLKELPSCLEEIATLQAIKLFYCTEDVEKSANIIKEAQQEDMLNVQFRVDIKKVVENSTKRIKEDMGNVQLVVDITEITNLIFCLIITCLLYLPNISVLLMQ